MFTFSYFMFKLAICRGSNKSLVLDNDNNSMENENKKVIVNDENWLLNKQKIVNIKSIDGLKLCGYIVNNKSDNWVILVHGFSSDHNSMISRAMKFYDMGYSVLLIDLRGHGNSEGKYITMGIKDCLDIKSWCEYLVGDWSAKSIVLFGISMGAASVMMSLDKDLPSEVTCAIEDCGYTSVMEEYKYQLKNIFHLFSFPFLNICNLYSKLIAKFSFNETSSISSISNSSIPLLMIHGTNDKFVPYNMLDVLYKSCNSRKEKFIVKGANHAEAMEVDYDNYWKTIEIFIK